MERAAAKTQLRPDRRDRILEAARQLFAELGYERVSMDLIAERAGVSKATVYGHFEDKRALFQAALLDVVCDLRDRIAKVLEDQSGDVAVDLQRVGESFLEVLLAPASIALHRVLAAEVVRFPELGSALWEHCNCTTKNWLASYLERQHAAGVLQVDDALVAARQFLALCQVDLVVQAQFGITPSPGVAESRAAVSQAVRTFLRANRP